MFAQLRSEPEDPYGNLTAVGVDIFQFWSDNFNDFDPMAAIYSGWAERFSVNVEYGITIEKNINSSWTEVVTIIMDSVGHPSNGVRWVYDGTVYLGTDVATFGNGTYRGKGWAHAWYLDVYDESDWDTCTVNDVISPDTPTTFSGSWSGSHPMLTIRGNDELDLQGYNIYKKVDNGSWNYLANITGETFIDYGETQYTHGNKIKRNVYYKAKAVDYTANESYETASIKFVCNDQINKSGLGKDNDESVVAEFKLEQNYPNPFNPSTEIRFSLAKTSFVDLSVYNMLGQKVKTLVREIKEAGHYSINFNASGLSAGTYIYKIATSEFTFSRKMILMK